MVQTAHELIEALYRTEGKAEIVDGRILEMPPAADDHGFASGEAFASLRTHARATGVGRAVPDGVGFVVNLPNRWSFSPDTAFVLGPVMRGLQQGAPIFAIEIRSPDDDGPVAEGRLAAKRADYFAAGTRVGWDVDLVARTIAVYRLTDPLIPTIYGIDDIAEAEPAVPGWTMAVRDLFPEDV